MDFSIEMIRSVYEGRRPEAIGKHRYFSVLVPFVERDGELCLLYEVRAESVSQPGEVCFPGGHVEKGEHPCDCALRETYEEIGVPADRVRLIGPGDRLYGYANFTLFTYLGVVDYEDYKKAKLAEDEVSEIFLMSVVQNQPQPPLEREDLDDIYEQSYENAWHPMYDAKGGIPAFREVKFSIVSSRGCFGGCSFCALTYHAPRLSAVED